MKNGKSHLVILQMHEGVLKIIEKSIKLHADTQLHNPVNFCSSPISALDLAETGQGDFIITGDRFTDNSTFNYNGTNYPIFNACDVAKAAHYISPDTLVIRYSSTPSENIDGLAGDIDKDDIRGSIDTMVKLATLEELPKIIQTKDWLKLRQEFSGITFYDTLEKYTLPVKKYH